MTNYILTAIVATTALNSIVSARYSVDHRRIKIADYGMRVAVWSGITSLLALALWGSLAFTTSHWQFAAIIAVPLLITIGSTVTRPTVKATQDGDS